MKTNPTDNDILAAVEKFGATPTGVARNILSANFKGIKTGFVLRRLKKLEQAGKVKTVKSGYATQYCWRVVV